MKPDRREFLEAIKSKDISLVNSLITAELAKCYDDEGTTMLTWASFLGLLEICKVLLDHGADLEDASPETGITPLLASAKNGHLDASTCTTSSLRKELWRQLATLKEIPLYIWQQATATWKCARCFQSKT